VGLAAWLVAGGAQAQLAPSPPASSPTLTLSEAIARATTGNPDLLRERVAVEIAAANVLAAEGQFDLTLAGDATYRRGNTPRLNPNDILAGSSGAFTANLGLSRPLETGGSLRLAAQGTLSKSGSILTCANMTTPCTYYASALNLTFNQPLLRGFGTEVTLANLRKQRIQHDIALANREARAAVVLRDVVIAYWELAYTAEDLAIRRSAVALAEEQRKATQAMVDVGRTGALELAAVERAIADRGQEVALAEQAQLGRALDLERLCGRAVPGDFRAYQATDRPPAGDAAAVAAIDPAAETRRALASSPSLRALRAGMAVADIDARTAAALVRPRLDFAGTVGLTGRNFDLVEARPKLDDAGDINFSAGLIFELPLQNRAARGAERAAAGINERARIDATTLELQIRDGAVRLSAATRTAVRRGELARAAVGFAGKNLEAERARFEVGRSTNNDVLLRQQELKNAEIQVARAAFDQAAAEAALEALTGEILERHRVVLRGVP
jgi:outer membrane protein TolC